MNIESFAKSTKKPLSQVVGADPEATGRLSNFIDYLNNTFFMLPVLHIFFAFISVGLLQPAQKQERTEKEIVHELFRLRNEHKADSAEQYYADTVRVYMKYFRNVSRKTITKSDKTFFHAHPKYNFEITEPVQVATVAGVVTATIIGKERLDGKDIIYEKIDLKFDRYKKIFYFRAFRLKKGN